MRRLGSCLHSQSFGRWFAAFVLIAGTVLCADRVRGQESSEPLILEHADSTELIRTGAETEYHLFGNVGFSHGKSTLQSDQATWKRESGQIEFEGHVTVHQPARWFAADRVLYQRLGRSVMAWGDVHLQDTSESFSLWSQRVRFDRGGQITVADSSPVIRWDFVLDSTAQTIVRADTIRYFSDERRGEGTGSVQIIKGDWQAQGGHGQIWADSGLAILTGSPHASGIGGEITGDTLIMEFAGRQVRRVQARGHASGSYHDTTSTLGGISRLHGHQADFFLSDDSLRSIRVLGEATTDNLPTDTTQGTNHASGDSLWLQFAGGRLTTVTIEGGGRGRYLSRATGSADTVDYRAGRIVFVPDSNRVDLETDGQLHYGKIVLDAGRISYWTRRKDLLAQPLVTPDSAGSHRQVPHLSDGEQLITGEKLTYNVDSRRGRIRGSATEFEGAYYHGGDFRKYSDSVFFVTHGSYTTCNLEEPHFHFESEDMEIIRGDKVIARPVVLKIGELPVAILPYYVFPIRRGRHSGFLPLRYGNFFRGQRFLGNAGYYWAASDYYDLQGALDYNEQTGVLFRGTVNYAWRYHFAGILSGSYTHESSITPFGLSRATRWSLRGSHQQTLSPTMSLAGNADFVSDKSYYQNYSFNPNDRRARTIRSQMNVNKRWRGASLTASLENTLNLDSDARTRSLLMDFSLFQKRILSPDSGATARWYQSGYVSFGSRLSQIESRDSTSGPLRGRFDTKSYLTVDHAGSVSFPQTVLKHVNVSPNASFSETWYYVFDTRLARADSVAVNDPARRLSGSVGVSTGTNLYGFLHPHLLGLSTLRHTLSPHIGYSFTPPVTRHDDLRAFTGAGSGSARRSQSMSFSLSNALDAKLFAGDKERKISVLNFGLSAGYDFERQSRKWSNLSGSARTTLARRLDLSIDGNWDLYNPQTLKLQWSNPRLTNFGVSAGMSLRGGASALSSVTALGEESHGRDTTAASAQIPFNASFSYRYSESRGLSITFKDQWLGWRFDFSPATNWSVQYQETYNWARHTVTDETFQFTRDLHCWQAVFVWRPGGSGQGYYFRINVKAIPDLKIERSESGLLGALRQF